MSLASTASSSHTSPTSPFTFTQLPNAQNTHEKKKSFYPYSVCGSWFDVSILVSFLVLCIYKPEISGLADYISLVE